MKDLQHYEFLEKQERLAMLPFKLNSIVYILDFVHQVIVRKKIRSIEFFADRFELHFYDAGHSFDWEIGRSTFENKADAERALAEHIEQQKKWTGRK